MRFMLVVPLFAMLLAFVSLDSAVPIGGDAPRWFERDPVMVLPDRVEVPALTIEGVPLASHEVNACTDASQLHEVQALTAVRLGEGVPARRWFHHERGCVAF